MLKVWLRRACLVEQLTRLQGQGLILIGTFQQGIPLIVCDGDALHDYGNHSSMLFNW